MKAPIARTIAARTTAGVRRKLSRRQRAEAARRNSAPRQVHSAMNQRNGVAEAPKPFISVYCSGGAAPNRRSGCSMPKLPPAWTTTPATSTASRPKYFEGLSVWMSTAAMAKIISGTARMQASASIGPAWTP